ncbi:MAG: [Fe-Fe] hydrogenase large subunit C-terminal domain-containing protein, partial [Oscillospiraceae bacterium]
MIECLKVKKTNCKNCYKCIRYCPVKSIRFSSGHANINYKDCILCGQCFIYCPQNANEIRNDIGVAKKLIEDGYEVYASLAPSFVANYDGKTISSLKKALLQLGFHDVQETAIGATIVKNKYAEMINSGEHNIIISSCCPSVNMLIQKYYPEALDYLAKVMSPMQAHCSLIKSNNINAKTVFIGPCISKKAEADESPETVDCVLTFEELSEWLFMEGIKLEDVEDDNLDSGKTRMFPTNGGILNTMDCTNPDFDYIIIDGVSNCMSALEDIIRGGISNTFIEMSSCSGSCLGGPVMKKAHASPVRDYL